jgi:hypothetical protein
MAATISNGRSRLPDRAAPARSRVAYATAAACAAAVATLIAIDLRLGETPATFGAAAGAASSERRERFTFVPAPVALDRGFVPSDRVLAIGLTPDAVEQALAAAPLERRDLLLIKLLAQLAGHDAPGAARVAERIERGYLREAALRTVAQHWARRDPDSAVTWAVSLSDQVERDAAIANVALELADPEPERALQLLTRRFAPPSPDAALEGVIQQWATRDFASAYAWTEAQPAGPARDALLMRLTFVRVDQDPADAARIANGAFHDDAHRLDAVSTVALLWGDRDPRAAREWAMTLDPRARQHVRAELELLESPSGPSVNAHADNRPPAFLP